MSARMVGLVVVATILFGFATFVAYLASFDDYIERWNRSPTAQDLPRTWFDGRIGVVPKDTCVLRRESYVSKKLTVVSVTSVDLPVVAANGTTYTIAARDLATANGRLATKDEIVAALKEKPYQHDQSVDYRVYCATEGESLRVDGCIGANGTTIAPCTPSEDAGMLGSSRDLRAQRRRIIVSGSFVVMFPAPGVIVFFFVLKMRLARAGHRLLPLARRSPVRTIVVLTLPFAALVAMAISYGAAPVPALVVFVPLAPFVYLVLRASRFYDVIHALEAPARGMIVVEGKVGDESPLGLSVLDRKQVAVSFVAVARVVRGKGVTYVPVGEVHDVGRVDVTTDTTTVSLNLDDAILELELDSTSLRQTADVPPEIVSALTLENDSEYRLREYSLDRGDAVCVYVEGAAVVADGRRAVEGGAYRSSPRMTPASVVVPQRARPAIFEGSRVDAQRRLRRKALTLELWAAPFGGMAIAAIGWAFAVGALLR